LRSLYKRGSPATETRIGARWASKAQATEEAGVLLAAIEGALVLARARRSTEPLDAVERHFTTGGSTWIA
jgi:hypothetical protein